MIGKNVNRKLSLQSAEDKIYVLKLIAHQFLGERWIYYRKIKRGDQGISLFKEKSLMEQMKATRAALRFTTKNARKLYKQVYLDSIKDIKAFTGLKTEFPEIEDDPAAEMPPALTSDHDAVIIGWTPIKFFLPIAQLRSKGMATQRHTEGLACKLFFKVAGFYADPANWDRYKLNIYLRRLTKSSSYQDVVSELAPLKADLDKFVEVYEPFKFGKASLSKDVATDSDAFDDAMGVESFEAQLSTLYWHHFIYLAIEQFIFHYFLILVTSTPSREAIRYLTTIFEPVLQRVIENKNIFLGSFETDRTKRSFRVPYQKIVNGRAEGPLTKSIKTQKGTFETYTYILPLLEKSTISFEFTNQPAIDSDWWKFIKQQILNIGKPPLEAGTEEGAEQNKKEKEGQSEGLSKEQLEKKKKLKEEIDKYLKIKKMLAEKKSTLEGKTKESVELSKEERIELEEQKSKLLKEELKLDKEGQKLKEQYQKLEAAENAAELSALEARKKLDTFGGDIEFLQKLEEEIEDITVRQFTMLAIMTMLINCSQLKRLARYKILERFKQRVKNDQELEAKRIEEIRKQAEKKLRELQKKKGKMERLKQQDTVNVVVSDIERFKKGIDERIEIIKQDSVNELRQQKERLNKLFDEIAKEKSLNLGTTSGMLLSLIREIEPQGEFILKLPSFLSELIQKSYVKEFEPLYKHIFDVFELPVGEKIMLIQSLEKSGGEKSIKLSLRENEQKDYQEAIQKVKEGIEKKLPGIFQYKVVYLTNMIPVEDLFKLSLEMKSLNNLLLLKLASPKSTQPVSLTGEVIKDLMELNKLVNPIPKNSIMQEGREKEKNPEKRLNSAKLSNLMSSLS